MLDEILDGVRADLAERQQRVSLDQLKEMAGRAPSPRDAAAALKSDGVSVIAEVKRASPSRGSMAEIADPAALAARTATVAVLDLTMPGLDARRLRRLLAAAPAPSAGRLPALFLLSAAMRPRDLRVAAESCLRRPFSPRLLVARVLAIAPRPAAAAASPAGTPSQPAQGQPVLRTAGGLTLDPVARRARPGPSSTSDAFPGAGTREGPGIALTSAEFALLAALAEHPGRATSGRAIDVHVSQLRAKLPDPALIRTVRGVGYILDETGQTAAATGDG